MGRHKKPAMVSCHVRLYPKEVERWKKNAERCGMSQSEYVRRLLRGVVPKEFPPREYAEILREMREIRDGIQIQAEIAKLSGNTGADQFWDLVEAYNVVIRKLRDEAYDSEEAPYEEETVLYGDV